MNRAQAASLSHLPLSWARTNRTEPVFDVVELPYSAPNWIPSAEIPQHYSFDQLYHEHLNQLPDGFVLQNCSLPLRDYLIEQGCQVAAMGAEAVLDLPWKGKRSVRELARRGRRHGTVQEIEWSQLNSNKLDQLIRESPSRQGVQLRHTERAGFDAATRCFIFETAEKKWMGAITLSTTALGSPVTPARKGMIPDYVHTEMILRHREAPVGVMEAMITAITQQLMQEGARHLSLGNVTPLPTAESDAIFAPHRHPQELWMRSQLSFRLGRALNFAHNADGLWRFKNKFTPRWEPLYLCASPRLSWATVAGLIQATGYVDLVLNQLIETWPLSVPSLRAPLPRLDALLPFGTIVQKGA